MRIGIISNSDSFIPTAYSLAAQNLQVNLFYSPSHDAFINQKVYAFVKQQHIPLFEERNSKKDLYNWLIQGKYDACFVIGYKHLIHLNRLNTCSTPLFNIHFSSLPAFKGPVPIFWQLKHGVEKLGVSIHKLSQKFDEGPVVWQKEIDNKPHYNYQLVNQIFNQACVEGVFSILSLMINKMPLPVIETPNIKSSYHKRPELSDILINWKMMGAQEIQNLIRAGNPWNKGALTLIRNQELKLMDASIVDNNGGEIPTAEAGTIINDDNCLHIACADAKILNVNMLFYNDCYLPAYQCRDWGLVTGSKIG